MRMGKSRQRCVGVGVHMESQLRKLSTNGDQKEDKHSCLVQITCLHIMYISRLSRWLYRIEGNFGEVFNLAIWRNW